MKLNKDFPRRIYLDKRVLVNGIKRNNVNYENNIELSEWIQNLIDNGDIIIPIQSETPITGINNDYISWTVNGDNNHTIEAILDTDAILAEIPVFTETILTANDSTTIDFSTSGTNNHTLTGAVKISSTAGNQLSITGNGLFVPSISTFECSNLNGCSLDNLGTAVTSINGITGDGKIANPIKLGGLLNQNTTIDGSSSTYDLNIKDVQNFTVTSGSVSSATSEKILHSFNLPTNYAATGGYNAISNIVSHNLNSYSILNGRGITTHNINSIYNIIGNTTILQGSELGSSFNIIKFNALNTNVLLTRTQATAGGTLLRHIHNLNSVVQLDSGSTVTNQVVTINKFANFSTTTNYDNSFNCNNFTEFVQFYIGNAKGDATVASSGNMPNTYGIWQEGADDKNLFRGPIILPAIQTYANDALAGAGGLISGTLYKTITGELRIKL